MNAMPSDRCPATPTRPKTPLIAAAQSGVDLDAVKALFVEYADALDFPLCFQGFDRELATFPGKYAPPAGFLLLARHEDQPLGAVGLRPLDAGICEMKRLYVRPEARGTGLGRDLAAACVARARTLGYRAMRLDSIAGRQDTAIALYRRLGFQDIPPYYENPIPGAVYLELGLTSNPSAPTASAPDNLEPPVSLQG